MQVVSSPQLISDILFSAQKNDKKVGLVPTMGALHNGHMSLIKACKEQNDISVVSIFVNPLQFNNAEDLENYPRPLDHDTRLLAEIGVDILYTPTVDEMYPYQPLVNVSFGTLSNIMEGKFRPGHFNGVGLVVTKLLNQVAPDRAYFGIKDLQQFLLVKRLAVDLSFNTDIIGLPIIREENGLAMSSRNARLSQEGQNIASSIFKGLEIAQKYIDEGKSIGETKLRVLAFYREVKGLDLEYLEFVDPIDLSSYLEEKRTKDLAICFAGYVEGIRLIDNLYLPQD